MPSKDIAKDANDLYPTYFDGYKIMKPFKTRQNEDKQNAYIKGRLDEQAYQAQLKLNLVVTKE